MTDQVAGATERASVIRDFLDRHGWGTATRMRVAGDASFRKYDRLSRERESAILMDAPPPQEDVRPFVRVARLLLEEGFRAPAILAEDAEAGLLLLEDFGDDRFTRVLAKGGAPDTEEHLYAAAVDLLSDLHRRDLAPRLADLPRYDVALFQREARLFPEWYLAAFSGLLQPRRFQGGPVPESFDALWEPVVETVSRLPQGLVLRDYHADNLMVLPPGATEAMGPSRCGLLDFQDAVRGPIPYDLVSLLEDARRDVDPGVAERMLRRYLQNLPGLDGDAYRAGYALLGAQRNLKIIGIFTRLAWRDGKRAYLDLIPRVWRHLERDLSHPACAPIRAWIDAAIPAENRVLPPGPDAV